MRFCDKQGNLILTYKGTLAKAPPNLVPWYAVAGRKPINVDIVFGHWAALGGVTNTPNTFALDTGCVYGFTLTAMRLEDRQRFDVRCQE